MLLAQHYDSEIHEFCCIEKWFALCHCCIVFHFPYNHSPMWILFSYFFFLVVLGLMLARQVLYHLSHSISPPLAMLSAMAVSIHTHLWVNTHIFVCLDS
jgi:hypothetical protein